MVKNNIIFFFFTYIAVNLYNYITIFLSFIIRLKSFTENTLKIKVIIIVIFSVFIFYLFFGHFKLPRSVTSVIELIIQKLSIIVSHSLF